MTNNNVIIAIINLLDVNDMWSNQHTMQLFNTYMALDIKVGFGYQGWLLILSVDRLLQYDRSDMHSREVMSQAKGENLNLLNKTIRIIILIM